MARAIVVALILASMLLLGGASSSAKEEEMNKAVAEIVAWHRPRVARLAEQLALVWFVDPTGELVTHLHFPEEGQEISDWEFISACIMSEGIRSTVSSWYDAISYANREIVQQSKPVSMSYEQLAEIQRRVVGHDAFLSGLKDPRLRQEVIGFLEQLNSGLEAVSEMSSLEQRVVESSKLAAWSMLTLQELHPFVDGNGRLMEVINSVIMQATGVTPFAFKVRLNWNGWVFADAPTRLSRGEVVSSEEMARYIVSKLRGAWGYAHRFDDEPVSWLH